MIGSFLRRVWRRITEWFGPSARPFSLVYVGGDELPAAIPTWTLVVAREDGDLWSAGMTCPCGCRRRIELMLLAGVEPRWDLHVGTSGRPTLWPSVRAVSGCRAHFWLRDGEVHWCRD
jgi:Family of unknown function (DUF6527)